MFLFKFNHIDIAVVAISMIIVLLNFNSTFKELLKEVLLNSNTSLLVVTMVAVAIIIFINGNWIGGLWMALLGPVSIYETVDPPMGQQ